MSSIGRGARLSRRAMAAGLALALTHVGCSPWVALVGIGAAVGAASSGGGGGGGGSSASATVAFQVQPADVIAGQPTTLDVTVAVRDSSGAIDTTATNHIEMFLRRRGGGPDTKLGDKNATAGLARFNGELDVTVAGRGLVLVARSPQARAEAVSGAFDVTHAAPDHVAFLVSPASGIPARKALVGPGPSPPTVGVRDRFGNLIDDQTTSVSIEVQSPGSVTLFEFGRVGPPVRTTQGGLASFGGVRMDRPAAAVVLRATAPPLVSGSSAPFDVADSVKAAWGVTRAPGDPTPPFFWGESVWSASR